MKKSGMDQFIQRLSKAGELEIVEVSVDHQLEITEIADRFSKEPGGGKALLFKQTGTDFPVLINALGSEKRMELALGGKSANQLALAIQELTTSLMTPATKMTQKLSLLPRLRQMSSWMPKRRKGKGICQEVVMDKPDLRKLPVLKCWPADAGPFITFPLVHTQDPNTGQRNVGMYRLQVMGPDETGMHWHIHKTGARHYRAYQKLGQRMPVAVALGGDPAYTYSATAPLPDGIDEYILAGFLRNKRVELVKCLTQDIWVPADADFVLEGYVDTAEDLVTEGPFGDHTGFYSLADKYPKFHLTAITHRKNAIYPATIVGVPPMEDAWIALVTEKIFREPLKLAMIQELEDFHLPESGVAHNIGLYHIHTSYPGQGKKILSTVWGAGQMMFTKFGVVFNDIENLKDYRKLAQIVTKRIRVAEHISFTSGPLDILDHASNQFAFGGKMGVDATGPDLDYELPDREGVLSDIQVLRSVHHEIERVDVTLIDLDIAIGLIAINKNQVGQVRELGQELINYDQLSRLKFWIIVDSDIPDLNWFETAWLVGAHVDPSRDCMMCQSPGMKEAFLLIDATRKSAKLDGFQRDWPNPVVMSKELIELVDNRWLEYGIGAFIESPSRRYRSMSRGTGAVAEE